MKEGPRRNDDSAGPTNLEGIRRGNRTRVLNTRLKGYKVGM
jgi:hypothetical protein